jgi:hypothetical protein
MDKRDLYTRCKYCKKLSLTDDCILDPIDGYQCPSGCKETFEQPPYNSPLPSDEDSNNTKEM